MENRDKYEDVAGIGDHQALVAAIKVPHGRRFHVDVGGAEKRGVL